MIIEQGESPAKEKRMTYYKLYKGTQFAPQEVTKEKARETLEGYYNKEALDDIFENGKEFRLATAYSEIWTNNDGMVPMAGFYGIVG